MKSMILSLIIFSSFTVHKCKHSKEDKIPVCIQQKIDSIKMQPRWNPPAEVHEYLYKGKKVFYFSANCCDQYNVVYDEECHYVCAPSGGYTGKGDRVCEDFFKTAKELRLVWKDGREY